MKVTIDMYKEAKRAELDREYYALEESRNAWMKQIDTINTTESDEEYAKAQATARSISKDIANIERKIFFMLDLIKELEDVVDFSELMNVPEE